MTPRSLLSRAPFWVFCILPFVYFMVHRHLGLSETDGGFIPALSYRVSLGEVAGEDFIYVRPPLTPYFHALEILLLPDHLEMLGMRFWYYVCMWLSVLFGVKALQRVVPFEEMGTAPWMVGILGYAYALHAFPAMPWHTTDGVLFASLGFFLITRGPQPGWTAAGLGAMVLSAMAKQPFAVSVVAGMATALALHPRAAALKGIGIAAAAGVALLGLLMVVPGTRQFVFNNLSYMGGGGQGEFFYAGIGSYAAGLVFGIPPLLLWLLLKYVVRTPHSGWIMALVVLLFVTVWVPYQTYAVYKGGHWRAPRFGFYHLLLVGGMAGIMLDILKPARRKAVWLLLCMGAVSWASGISWGYTVPVLLCLPGLVGVLYFLTVGSGFRLPQWVLPVMALVVIPSFLVSARYPYMEKRSDTLTYHLGELYPRLNGIYTHKERYDKHVRFKALHAKYGDNFEVLPAFPMGHYLTHTKPVSLVDWEHDGEMGYDKGVQQVIKRFEERGTTVFVEPELLDDAYAKREVYRCSVLKHVLENWTKVEEDQHFIVYQPAPSRP